ncbi:unnamed protein product, partial [Pocillopora meandrina]
MLYSQLPTPPPMSLKGNLADNWTFFRESWESCKIATELDKKPKPVILETLKIVLGRETYQIAKKSAAADRTDPDKNENMDRYLNRLRKLASTCAYGALCDELIRDRLVIGIKSHEVRKRLLREKALTLNTALDIIRAAETASDQLKKIDGEIETSVHACKMKNHFAKMCRIRDQESQRRTQKAVKSVSKKPTRCIHRIEEAEPAITDD